MMPGSESPEREHEAFEIELLVALLAGRTDPGHGHLIFSAAEFDDEFERDRPSGESIDQVRTWVRALRNELVHGHIRTASSYLLRKTVTEVEDRIRKKIVQPVPSDRPSSRRHVTSAVAALTDSFVDHLATHAEVLNKLNPHEAANLGRRAAEEALAAARWSQVVGDRLDTSQVKSLLGVTRQALAKRQRAGSLLGLPGEGTTWYPAWQFDAESADVHPEVRDIIGAFRDRLDDVDPYIIASWATTPQDEDLDGVTPARWLQTGRDRETLRIAAARAAARLAR